MNSQSVEHLNQARMAPRLTCPPQETEQHRIYLQDTRAPHPSTKLPQRELMSLLLSEPFGPPSRRWPVWAGCAAGHQARFRSPHAPDRTWPLAQPGIGGPDPFKARVQG